MRYATFFLIYEKSPLYFLYRYDVSIERINVCFYSFFAKNDVLEMNLVNP